MSFQDTTIFTPEFERAIADLINEQIKQERTSFDTTLEPFQVHADKIREQQIAGWYSFRKSYITGYRVLLNEVKKKLPEGEDLTPFIAKTDNIAKRLGQDELPYSIFGFTNEVLQTFYTVAYPLFEQKQFQEAYDAFFFLVTIAPTVREFWLNFGYSALQLGQLPLAIESYGNAYKLDPTNADSYLATAHVYLRLEEKDNAYAVCDLGLDFARENQHEDWAKDLSRVLKGGKNLIAEGGNL